MNKVGRPSQYSSHFFTYFQARGIKKELDCVQFFKKKKTVESLFKVEQYHLHTGLGLSN